MLMKSLMLPALLTTLALLGEVGGQVNSEIDQFEDLLAVDSFDNEVTQDDDCSPLIIDCFNLRLLSSDQDLGRCV